MDGVTSVWTALDTRRKGIVALATVAVFVAVLLLSRGVGGKDMSLLYAGLADAAAGDVIAALDQRGVGYDVRGSAIFVETAQRDSLRMMLAGEGLPASTSQGYELLDGLSGFGTTSQMFDAAYWRAKEGELARTILASPYIRAARVHISTPNNRPFGREQRPTAAVIVSTANGSLSASHAKALRYLVASAVSGMAPDDVAVIDGEGGLMSDTGDAVTPGAESRADALRLQAERLLEARVGYGNAVVEVTIDTVMDSEQITERRIDPDTRVAISTEVEERANTSNDSRAGDVTVASNLPTGDAAGTGGSSANENTENRTLTNYEVSETQRAVTRGPGAVRRLTVAVLVNDASGVDASGAVVTTPRSDDELAALRDLVASAVGFDEARGDVLTLKSMAFEPIVPLGTAVVPASIAPINLMSLIQIGVLAMVTLLLGLFVVRPILTSGRRTALPAPLLAVAPPPVGLTGTVVGGASAAAVRPAIAPPEGRAADVAIAADPVARLRKMIAERETETIQILQSWIEDPEEVARA